MSKRGSGSSKMASIQNANEHKFESFVNGRWITDDRKVEAERQRKLATIVDNSRYKKSHNETIDFVKKQVGVNLNKYRAWIGYISRKKKK